MLCEGEKAADGAVDLLPEHVATCWPNGTNSWQKADFAALVGRDVLLWPDNDAPLVWAGTGMLTCCQIGR